MAEKWVKMIFPDHSVNRKVVDNIDKYLNMQFQPKPDFFERKTSELEVDPPLVEKVGKYVSR